MTVTSNKDGVPAKSTEWISETGNYHAVVFREYDSSEIVLSNRPDRPSVRRDWNGFLRTIRGRELRRMRAGVFELQVSVFGPPPEMLPVSLRTDRDSIIVMQFLPPGCDTTVWYIDRNTWLPLRSARLGEDSLTTISYNDWRKTEGLMIPRHGRVVEPGKPEDEWERTGLEVRDDESLKDFEILTPAVSDTRMDSIVPPIPFNFENGHIIFPLSVNGKDSALFIFDTGADEDVINTPYVAEFGLHPYGKTTTTGGGGSADYGFARGATFRLPGVEIRNQHVAIMDERGLEKALGMKFGGILGYDFISRFVVEIDYTRHEINLHDPKIWSYSGNGYVVPVTFDVGIPFANAMISVRNKQAIPAYFVLDFGAFETMTLTSPFVKANDLIAAAGTNSAVNRPAGLENQWFAQNNVRGRIDQLTLGNLVVKSFPANFSVNSKGAYASPQFSGTVGEGIYQRYHVYLDYARDRIIFEPTPQTDKPYPDRRTYGMSMIASGADLHTYTVTAVRAGSPAEKDGFKKGDVIVGLDGKPASRFTLGELRDSLSHDAAHQDLKIMRGANKQTMSIDVRLISLEKQ